MSRVAAGAPWDPAWCDESILSMVCIAPIGVVGTEMTDGMWPEGWSRFGGLDCGALMGGTRTRDNQGGDHDSSCCNQ